MNFRIHLRFHLPALALLVFSSNAIAQGPADAALSARVDSIANAVLASTGVPSATVAVVTHGKLAYAQAYGAAKLEPHVAATPDMQYGIGSISKQFTAACVLLLQQEGKLSLDDKISKYVPGLTRGNEITIRQILSHTSGYQDFWPQDYVPPAMEKSITPQAILDHWAKQPLDFEPGTRWQYSNTNFEIAALIVEKASGKPFYQFVRTRILDPLGMTSAVDFDAKGPTSVQPVGYMRFGLGPLRPATSTGPGWMYGAGELAMTARDLAKWDIAMINQSLLKPESYRAMQTAVLLKNGVSTDYGLGVDVDMQSGHRLIEHSGEVAGFTAENFVYPDDSAAVIVLTNQDAAPASTLIAGGIGRTLFTNEDASTQARTTRARDLRRTSARHRRSVTAHRGCERLLQHPGASRLSVDAIAARHADGIRPDGAEGAWRDARADLPGDLPQSHAACVDVRDAGRKARAVSARARGMTRALAPLALAALAASLGACSHPAGSANESHPDAHSPDAIIAHYYRAIGGHDRLEKITSRHMWGAYSEGKLSATTDMAWKRPMWRRVNVHAPGFDYSEGFDSLTWEYGFQSGKLVIDTGAAAAAGRRGAEFDESFVDAASKGHHVSLVGAERFADRPAHRLRVSLADGWEKEYVFDDSTGLIVALRKAMPVHATGAPVTSVTVYDDWRVEGGVLQPHRFIERELQSGRLMNTLQWDSIRTNVDLGERELGRPAH